MTDPAAPPPDRSGDRITVAFDALGAEAGTEAVVAGVRDAAADGIAVRVFGPAAALAELGNGSPGTDGLIALVTLQRGHDLYSQGLPRAAIATLLAGTPRFEGLGDIDLSRVPKHIEPATRPVPLYEPRVALGDAAHNLHYASVIARATGAEALGRQLWALSNAVGPVEPKFAPLPASPDII